MYTKTTTDPLATAVAWELLLRGDRTYTLADVEAFLHDAGSLVEADPSPGKWAREYLASRGAGVAD